MQFASADEAKRAQKALHGSAELGAGASRSLDVERVDPSEQQREGGAESRGQKREGGAESRGQKRRSRSRSPDSRHRHREERGGRRDEQRGGYGGAPPGWNGPRDERERGGRRRGGRR